MHEESGYSSREVRTRSFMFVTNNEDLQPYAAAKAREYLDKPVIHETKVKTLNCRIKYGQYL